MLLHRHRQPCGEAVARGRRAVEIGAGDVHLQRIAPGQALLRAVELELHALGQELLDAQVHALHQLLAGRVGAELDLPAAGGRLDRDLLLEAVIALRAGLQARFHEHLAVGLLQAREQRLRLAGGRGRHRLAVGVAQQCRDAHGLAGTVEIAARPGEDLEPGLPAPGHRELGEIQRRLVEGQHGHVAAAAPDQHLRGVEPVLQHGVAVAVGLGLEHRLPIVAQHLQVHAAQRAAVAQRCGVHEQLVGVGAHVQADVADAEEGGVVHAVEAAGALHGGEVQARLLQLGDVLQRQVGDRALVALAAEHEAVDVDRVRHAGDAAAAPVVAVELPAAAAAAALVVGEEARQLGLAHAQELDVDLGHVHRHHRQPARFTRRQHAALGREAGGRLQLAGVHLPLDVAAQRAAIGRGQRGRDAQGVVAIGLDEGEAQDPALVVQAPAAVLAHRFGEGEQPVEVLRAHQRLRELDGQRQRTFLLVGPGADQAEAVHRGALGDDGLAAGCRELTALVALAAHGQERQQHGTCGEQPQAGRASDSLHGASIVSRSRLQYRSAVTCGGTTHPLQEQLSLPLHGVGVSLLRGWRRPGRHRRRRHRRRSNRPRARWPAGARPRPGGSGSRPGCCG